MVEKCLARVFLRLSKISQEADVPINAGSKRYNGMQPTNP